MKAKRIWYCLVLMLMGLGIGSGLRVAAQDKEDDLRVTAAWVRPGEEMSAAYMQIHNAGRQPQHLVAVEVSGALAEVHEMQMDGDIMRMQHVERLEIPAGETLRLKPGGYHVMLMELAEPLQVGDSLDLTLIFATGTEIRVTAWVSQNPIPNELAPDALTNLALEAVAAERYVGQVVNPPIAVQDFEAPASDADLQRLSDSAGTWRVIFVGYMHCPDFCPLTLATYRRAKALLGDLADEVSFVFISVDAVRDTPSAIRRYLDNFDTDFIGFAPDDATLQRIQPDYGFYYERRLDEGTQAIYTIDHSTRSYVLDREGVLRTSFAYDTPAQDIADMLTWYLEHEAVLEE